MESTLYRMRVSGSWSILSKHFGDQNPVYKQFNEWL